jgi:hypothetical protein
LIGVVEKRIEESKIVVKAEPVKASYFKLLLTFADRIDMTLIFFGYLFAIITGILSPAFIILQGNIVNDFNNSPQAIAAIKKSSLTFLIIGFMLWVSSYLFYSILIILSERLGRKTKLAYLRSILK